MALLRTFAATGAANPFAVAPAQAPWAGAAAGSLTLFYAAMVALRTPASHATPPMQAMAASQCLLAFAPLFVREGIDASLRIVDQNYTAGLALPAGRTPLSCVRFTDQARGDAQWGSQLATSTPYGSQ